MSCHPNFLCQVIPNLSLTVHLLYSYLYQIAHLGDDDDEPEFSSSMPLEEGVSFFFDPRALRNLVLVDELDSLAPIMSCQVCDCGFFCILLHRFDIDGLQEYRCAMIYAMLVYFLRGPFARYQIIFIIIV